MKRIQEIKQRLELATNFQLNPYEGMNQTTKSDIEFLLDEIKSLERIGSSHEGTIKNLKEKVERYEAALNFLYLGDWSSVSGAETYSDFAEEALEGSK